MRANWRWTQKVPRILCEFPSFGTFRPNWASGKWAPGTSLSGQDFTFGLAREDVDMIAFSFIAPGSQLPVGTVGQFRHMGGA